MQLDDRVQPDTLEVSTTGALDAVTWRLYGETDRFLPWLGGLMALDGLDPDEVARLEGAGEALNPAWAGASIELHPKGLTLCWLFPGDLPLNAALNLCHPFDARDALTEWAHAHDLRDAHRVGRSLVAGAPHSELSITLEARTLEDALSTLRVPYPDALIETCADLTAVDLRLVLGPDGLVEARVAVPTPPPSRVVLWSRLVGHTPEDLDALARFEGQLGGQTAFVEWILWRDGQALAVTHTFSGDVPDA